MATILTTQLPTAAPRPRERVKNGKKYLGAPASILMPNAVLPGSKGALFYPAQEVFVKGGAWNGMPATLGHPVDSVSGEHVSAQTPGILDKQGCGFLDNDRMEDGKRKVDVWFDVAELAKKSPETLNRIRASNPIEVSTGLYTDNEPAPPGSAYGGRPYEGVARNYRSDHLAILVHDIGACSINDGCGINNSIDAYR
jgi:hypothetical protein